MSASAPNATISRSSDFSPNFEDLLKKLNEEFTRLPVKTLETFRFGFDGLNFDVRRAERENKHRFLMNATIGYMPFTIEASERREAIKTIVIATQVLPTVRFGVDVAGKISAGAYLETLRVPAPDFIFYPLALFMQEARPYINLIGKYLPASAPNRTANKPP
jgi:hypothetical protein